MALQVPHLHTLNYPLQWGQWVLTSECRKHYSQLVLTLVILQNVVVAAPDLLSLPCGGVWGAGELALSFHGQSLLYVSQAGVGREICAGLLTVPCGHLPPTLSLWLMTYHCAHRTFPDSTFRQIYCLILCHCRLECSKESIHLHSRTLVSHHMM